MMLELNNDMALIDELYAPEECERIKAIYSEDVSARQSLMQSFGHRIIANENILTSKPLDILALVCMTATFASSPLECQTVAIIVHKHILDADPLPYVVDDHGITLAEKCLVSLSFFLPAMERRHKRRGAPSPSFYRNASKIMFSRCDQQAIADHHEQWESFFAEMLLM
jgi:hypothetical protein